MSNKLNIDSQSLDFEYKMLMDELDSLSDLYNEAKDKLDAATKVPSRANPVFMASQTANLISIKEKRLQIIKELTNIKKSKIDFDIKVFNTNNKLEENETGISKEILDIYRLLNKNDKLEMLNEAESNEEETKQIEYSDEEIDDIFEKRLNEDKEKQKEKKKKEQVLPSEYSLVVTKNKEIFIVDGDYNIIEDYDFDTSVINIIEFNEVNGEEFGYDDQGNVYEVVEL